MSVALGARAREHVKETNQNFIDVTIKKADLALQNSETLIVRTVKKASYMTSWVRNNPDYREKQVKALLAFSDNCIQGLKKLFNSQVTPREHLAKEEALYEIIESELNKRFPDGPPTSGDHRFTEYQLRSKMLLAQSLKIHALKEKVEHVPEEHYNGVLVSKR